MAAAATVFNHALTAGHTLAGVTAAPMTSAAAETSDTAGTSGSSGSSDSSSDSATISANDFLTLLVTEMQNQDPTADTDPNEYIDQLVQANSLEQLIDINQTLSTDLGGASSSSDSGSATSQAVIAVSGATGATAAASPLTAAHSKGAVAPTRAASAGATAMQTSASNLAPGNLSTPSAIPAAQVVAHALNGQTRARPAARTISAAQRLF